MPRLNLTKPTKLTEDAKHRVRMGYSYVHPSSFLGEQSQDGQSQHNARHPTQYPGGQVQAQDEPTLSPTETQGQPTHHVGWHPQPVEDQPCQCHKPTLHEDRHPQSVRHQTKYPGGQFQAQDEPALSPTETQGQPTHHVGWHPQPVEDQPCQCHKPTLHEDRHPQSVRHQTQYPHGQVQTNYTPYGPIPSPTMQPRQRQTQYPGAQAHAKYEPELSPIIVTVQPLPPIVTIEPRQHEAQCSCGQVQTNHGPELPPIIVTINPRQCHLNCHSQAVQDPSQHHQPNPHPAYPNLIRPDGSVRYILPDPGPPDGFIEENGLQVPIWYNPPGID